MPDIAVKPLAHLPYGAGLIGLEHHLENPESEAVFANEMTPYVKRVTVDNTADCVEDRRIIALANGVDDPEVLNQRVAYQRPGGLGLDTTKAAVGADATYLRDAKNFTEAYEKTVALLVALGFEDAGHISCGASGSVEKSVAVSLPDDTLLEVLPLLTTVDDQTAFYLSRNQQTKKRRLEAGFYGTWSSAWHEDFLAAKFPNNFATIEIDHDDKATHGHKALGALRIVEPGYGFAKTAFANQTGKLAFGITDSPALRVIEAIGGSAEERARLALELGVDPAHVFNGLVATGFPVFATV